MENVLAKLDMKTIKLSGFTELLKVRAAEAKTPFPTRLINIVQHFNIKIYACF